MIDDLDGLPDDETPTPQRGRPRRFPLDWLPLVVQAKAKAKRVKAGAFVRKAYASRGDDATFSRWVKIKRSPRVREAQMTLIDSPRVIDPKLLRRPAIKAGRSLFHVKGVKPVAAYNRLLVSGHCNVKIGRDVRKGKLRGYFIYTLSFEERATCPRTCHHWVTCYGNNMPYANRIDHTDPALFAALERDVEHFLSIKGRVGILVRLHALGDFFSAEYVRFWQTMLAAHPRLAVYGYTAWPPDSDIGKAVARAKDRYGDRFAIRWSNGGGAVDCTVPVQSVDEAVNAIVCPEQIDRVDGCGKCALCWGTRRNIAFLEH